MIENIREFLLQFRYKSCEYHIKQISNNTHPNSRKRNISCRLLLCVGEVLLNSGNKETLVLVKPFKDLLNRDLFFFFNFKLQKKLLLIR